MKKFPVNCLCGQIFNDTIDGVPIIEKYSKIGNVKDFGDESEVIIELNDGSFDTITIRFNSTEKTIRSVWYVANKIEDKEAISYFVRNNLSRVDNPINETFIYGNFEDYDVFVAIGKFGFMGEISFGLQFVKC